MRLSRIWALACLGNLAMAVDGYHRGSRLAFLIAAGGMVCSLIAWGGTDVEEKRKRAERRAREGIL